MSTTSTIPKASLATSYRGYYNQPPALNYETVVPPATNCDPYLSYADYLLNSLSNRPYFSPTTTSLPKAAFRDCSPFLPPDAEGNPGTSSLYPPTEFGMSCPTNVGPNDRLYSGNKNNCCLPICDRIYDDLINQWLAPSSNQTKTTLTATTNATATQQQLFHRSERHQRQPLKQEPLIVSSSPPMMEKVVKQDYWRLSVRALDLGTFYVMTSPEKRIIDLVSEIESKLFELYQVCSIFM